MTKQLYEEALADAKKLTEVAEDNAKRAVLEAVTPRIKQLIERELMNEFIADDEELLDDAVGQDSTVPQSPVPIAATASPLPNDDSNVAVSADVDGKVTLDLDALDPCAAGQPVAPPMFGEPVPAPEVGEEEYVLGLESLTALVPVISDKKNVASTINKLVETINNLKAVSSKLRETAGYDKQLARTISHVENTYEYVQERISDPAKKKVLERKLESCFQELTKLQELKMSKKKLTSLINEDDSQLDLGGDETTGDSSGAPGELTLKLTGLPDDVDLDGVGVDLVAGADDGAGDDDGGEDFDLGGDDEGDAGGDDADLGDLDLGGDEEGPGDQMESVRLTDDTVVEIDEGMLRREIARMKKLRESDDKVPSNAGNGVDAAAMDDFGGGSEECDPFLDGEVTTESEELDESDEVVEETQNRRKADDNGVSANSDMSSVAFEGLRRRIAFEKRVQERAKARGAALVKEAKRATGAKKAQLSKEYSSVAARHNESLQRSQKLTEQLAKARKLSESRSNSVAKQPAESKAEIGLRKQLAEQNLFNIKLVYANKVLQNESLTKRQKAQVIARLDEAKTSREAKLVYTSIVNTFVPSKKTNLKEGRDARVIGSSSRVVRSGSSQSLNEGFETDRWAALAGITKRS